MLGLRKRLLTSVVALAATVAGCDTFADRPPPDNGFPGGTNVVRPLPPTSGPLPPVARGPIPVAGAGGPPFFFDAGNQAGAAGLRAAGSGGTGAGAGRRAPATGNDAGPDDAGN
jgi:hypothetical protein